jgi:DNA modification methylase
MSGSGTTGEAARELGRTALLSDVSEEYTQMAEKRLGVERVTIPPDLEMQVA